MPEGQNLDRTLLAVLVGGMIAIPIITAVLGVWQTWLSNRVGQRVMHDLRTAVYRHLQRLSLAFFTRTRTGEVQSRIANDIGGVQTVVTSTATSIASNVTLVLATTVALFILDWRLALATYILVPGFVLLTRRVGEKRREIAKVKQGSMADISTLVEESLSVSGVLLGKTMGRGRELADRFERESARLADLELQQRMAGPLGDVVDAGDDVDHAPARLRRRRPCHRGRRRGRLDRNARGLHDPADAALLPRPLPADRAGRPADLARALRPRLRVPRPARWSIDERPDAIDPAARDAARRGRAARRLFAYEEGAGRVAA